MSTFIFDTDMCNAMNERIAKVVVGGTVALTAVDFAAGKNFSKKLLSVCNDLLRELARNDDNIVLNSSCKNVREVMQAMRHRSLFFNESSTYLQFKVVDYLVSQIQAMRLIRHNESTKMVVDEHEETSEVDSAMDVEEKGDCGNIERSKVAFQLDKICKLLQLHMPDNTQEVDILNRLARHIKATLQTSPDLLSNGPPLILQNLGELIAQQIAKLHAVEDLLFTDFELRRQMLIKRMEVTIESFLWSEKASNNEVEIRAAVRAQQTHLTASPVRYTLEHARAANVALLHEQSKKVTGDSQLSSGGAVKSIIKRILVGDVPDRGGRANEVRSKQLKADVRRSFGNNSFAKKSTTSSSSGGDGGGRDKEQRGGITPNQVPVKTVEATSGGSNKGSAGNSKSAGRGNTTKGAGSDSHVSTGDGSDAPAPNSGKPAQKQNAGSGQAAKKNTNAGGNGNTNAGAASGSGRKVTLDAAGAEGEDGQAAAKKKRNRNRGGGGGGNHN